MTELETPVPLLQHHGEFAELLTLYRTAAPRRVLEIGTYHGGSLYHWLRNATPGTTVVSIDRYDLVDDTHLYGKWAGDGVEIVVIRGDSNDSATAGKAAAHGPYEWIYIDADHQLRNVQRDWHLYRPLATPGGVVVFHDITPSSDPSLQADARWAELRAEERTFEIQAANGWGIGVVFVPEESAA